MNNLNLTKSLTSQLEAFKNDYAQIGKGKYLIIKNETVCLRSLALWEKFLRWLGFLQETTLLGSLKKLNELNKKQLPPAFLTHMQSIWDRTYPQSKYPNHICPLQIPKNDSQNDVNETSNNTYDFKEGNNPKNELEEQNSNEEHEESTDKSDKNNEEHSFDSDNQNHEEKSNNSKTLHKIETVINETKKEEIIVIDENKKETVDDNKKETTSDNKEEEIIVIDENKKEKLKDDIKVSSSEELKNTHSITKELAPEKEIFGNKYLGLVKFAKLLEKTNIKGVQVPQFKGIPSQFIEKFLKVSVPEIFDQWAELWENFSMNISRKIQAVAVQSFLKIQK